MLILRRRAGESILIGDSIEIEVTEIGPSKVKIAVRAPAEISVQRKEMVTTREQNRRASLLTVEARAALVQNLSNLFSQHIPETSDMSFEARYSGHPKKKGEPGTGMMPGCIPQQDVQHVDFNSDQRSIANRAE